MMNWLFKNLFQTDGELIIGLPRLSCAKKLSSLFLAYQNVRGLNIKLPKLHADFSAFSEDILTFTET